MNPLKNTTRSIVQKIDHDTPFNLYKIAPDINGSEVNVGSTVQIRISNERLLGQ